MKWVELSVGTPPEFVEPLSEVFYRYGHGGVAVEMGGGHNPDEGETPPKGDWVTVKTYIPLDSTTAERRSRIDLGVRLVAHLCPISPLRERHLEEKDWEHEWKKHFHVLHVGKGIVVVPTWREYRPRDHQIVIDLDPGMAFGTGHHPTTRMCLELLEELARPGVDVLDLGCGSGILSIAAANLGAGSVLSLETDAVAVAAAESNVRRNGVAECVRVVQGTLPHAEVPAEGCDVAVANISSRVISDLAGDLVAAVRAGGTLILSGILLDREAQVTQHLEAAGAAVLRRLADGDWVSLVASVR